MKRFIALLVAFILCFSLLIFPASAEEFTPAFNTSREMYEAAIEYMNAEYFNSDLGNSIEYASTQDITELTALMEYITANCSTDTEKCDAIWNWMDQNIKYSTLYYTAIDVFRHMSGICSGHAQLFATLSRLAGINTAVMRGFKADTNTISVQGLYDSGFSNFHEWSMAYCDGEWKLYDDLWGMCGETDTDKIATAYYIQHVDGIAPYNETDITYRNANVVETYYINGKFVCYQGTTPVTNVSGASLSVGGCLRYDKRYVDSSYKYYYTCYTGAENTEVGLALEGGIYCKNKLNYMYVKHNGILLEDTTFEYNGHTYYTTGTESIILNENILDNGLTSDMFNMYVGESFDLSNYYPDYTFYVFGNTDGVVIENGIITATEAGYTEVRIARNGSGTSLNLQIYDGALDSNSLFMELCDHEHTHTCNGHTYCDYCGYEIATVIEEPIVDVDDDVDNDVDNNVDNTSEDNELVENETFAEEPDPVVEDNTESVIVNEQSNENNSNEVSSNTEPNDVLLVSSLINLFVKHSKSLHRIFFFFI